MLVAEAEARMCLLALVVLEAMVLVAAILPIVVAEAEDLQLILALALLENQEVQVLLFCLFLQPIIQEQ
jgi:hypothetical protein